MMPAVTYLLCAGTSIFVAILLYRQYAKTKVRLLLWSNVLFWCLAIENVILFVDMVLIASIDFRPYRHSVALAGCLCMLYGLIWDTARRHE